MIKKQNGEKIYEKTEIADSFLKRTKGLMFKRNIPENYALVIVFDKDKKTNLHMLFVPFDVEAAFLDSKNRVKKIETLKAWTGRAKGKAKKIIEAKNLSDKIKVGDELKIQ